MVLERALAGFDGGFVVFGYKDCYLGGFGCGLGSLRVED